MPAVTQIGTARRRAMTAAALALVLLSGCSKKPGGQVLAVVDSDEITQPEVQAEAQAAGVADGQDFASYAPAMLDRVVQRSLLAEYAKQQNLNKGPEYLLRRRQMEQTLLANMAMRQIVTSLPKPTPADMKAFIAGNPALFADRQRLKLDQVRFPAPDDPKQIQALTGLGSLDAVEAKLKSENIPVVRGTSLIDTGAAQPDIAKQLAALKNGELFDVTINGTTLISAITDRSSAAKPSSTWSAEAAGAFQRQQAEKAMANTMKKLRADAKIKYAPAYQPDKSAAK